MATATRSTARAGAMQAGDNLTAEPVAALLADVKCVADADALASILDRRLADAEAARSAHGDADPLADDRAQDAHAAAAAPLDREVARCRAAIERLTGMRAEMVAADERAAAEARVAAARVAADDAEAAVVDYEVAARAAATALERLRDAKAIVEKGRRTAREHGLSTEGVLLPHERRSRPAEFETIETVEDGIRRRHDQRVRSAIASPDLTSARIELPAIDGSGTIVSQGLDRRF